MQVPYNHHAVGLDDIAHLQDMDMVIQSPKTQPAGR